MDQKYPYASHVSHEGFPEDLISKPKWEKSRTSGQQKPCAGCMVGIILHLLLVFVVVAGPATVLSLGRKMVVWARKAAAQSRKQTGGEKDFHVLI
jgi:hypothetical protein